MSALLLDRCVFLHVPKTGGTWATEALRTQGLVRATINAADGSTHPNLETVRFVTDRPVIASVREPIGWLRSFWRFFYARAWRDSEPRHLAFEPLIALRSDTFSEFAARYLNRCPGYVSEFLRQYAEGADWVCRQEQLLPDVLEGFKRFDQPCLPTVMEATPWRNASRPFDTSCSEELIAEIRKADRWIIEEFYGEG